LPLPALHNFFRRVLDQIIIMKEKKQISAKYKKGFSMGEVIITLFVVTVGIIGVVMLISNSIIHSADSRNQIIATELAQEGLELMRNIRDNNLKNSEAFDKDISAVANGCVDLNTQTSNSSDSVFPLTPLTLACPNLAGNPDYRLYYHDGSGFYNYVHDNSHSYPVTRFYRKITSSTSTNDNGTPADPSDDYAYVTVTSMVVWGNGTFPAESACATGVKCLYVKDFFTNQINQ
jgi:Tfp pilus assembly protein PilV